MAQYSSYGTSQSDYNNCNLANTSQSSQNQSQMPLNNYSYHPYSNSNSNSNSHSNSNSNSHSSSSSSHDYKNKSSSSSSSSAYGASRETSYYPSTSHSSRGRSDSTNNYDNRHSNSYDKNKSSSSSSSSLLASLSSPYDHKDNNNNSNNYEDSGNLLGYKGKSEFGINLGQPGASLHRIDWDRIQLQPFQKNFYREAPSLANVTEEEISKWRKNNNIYVTGKNIPKPIRTFEEAGFPEYILAEIRRAGFSKPTAIQSQGWPMAMSGRDVVGVAETGSGKTLAFLLPSIVHINAQPLLRQGDGPIILIIAPTRELACQIDNEANKFASSSKIKHTSVYGGVNRRGQIDKLRQGVEICICTPGRLLDFLESSTTNLRRVTYLVIDEADRLLDMGFEPQLKAILSQVRPDRQILMWSATWPAEVRTLAAEFMNSDTIQVAVGSLETSANHSVTQVIEVMQLFEKTPKLYRIIRDHISTIKNGDKPKILVFTSTKRMCDEVAKGLKRDGWPVTSIHGNKEQFERDEALKSFKSGKCPIMLATNVASRGIHVDDITLVINYDFPSNMEDYVHRIGRTARCGKTGTAISFITRDDVKRIPKLIAVLREANQSIPPQLLALTATSSSSSSYPSSRSNLNNNNVANGKNISNPNYYSSIGYHVPIPSISAATSLPIPMATTHDHLQALKHYYMPYNIPNSIDNDPNMIAI